MQSRLESIDNNIIANTSLSNTLISVIIRTYNEESHIAALINAINQQEYGGPVEIIVVDSSSTDKTVEIARTFDNVRIVSIPKELFSYGYALNQGLRHAHGHIAVAISAHCTPVNKTWLSTLIAPLAEPDVAISFGRQIGTLTSRLSEKRIFEKAFPSNPSKDSETIYNHNANSAFRVSVWQECPFDENLRGLEDLDYALKVSKKGLRCIYVPNAAVFHYHLETNEKVFNRYYRETLALKIIKQQNLISQHALIFDFIKALLGDYAVACKELRLFKVFRGVLGYRLSQYFAIYMAYHEVADKGLVYNLQNWAIKKISHGTYGVARLQQDGILKRAI